jgi:hypothetical protein
MKATTVSTNVKPSISASGCSLVIVVSFKCRDTRRPIDRNSDIFTPIIR